VHEALVCIQKLQLLTRLSHCAQVIAMDGMYTGYAGAKTDHSITALADILLARIFSVSFYLVPRFAGIKHMCVFTYWCVYTTIMSL
jgi:hypothetical protein